MSHSQFHCLNCLNLDVHGLIFETSVWLLAGSTRFLLSECSFYTTNRQKCQFLLPNVHKRSFFTNPVDIHHSTSTKKEGCCSSGCYTIAYYHVIIQHMEFFQQSIQLIVSSIFYTSGCFHDHRYKKSHITIEGVGTTRRSKSSVRAYFREIQD